MNDQEKAQIKAETERILKANEETSKMDDPVVRVRFQNIEDPPAPGRPSPALEFSYAGWVFKVSRDEDTPDTALRHGEEYDLPSSVVNHLNSLSVPVFSQQKDPKTGALKTVRVGVRNRFSCVPVRMGDFPKSNAPAPKKRRPAKKAA